MNTVPAVKLHIVCKTCASTQGVSVTMQVLVDISTPAEVFDRVDAAVGAHTSLHAGEFTGKRLVCARDAGEPLKYALCVFYEFPHNGEGPFVVHRKPKSETRPCCHPNKQCFA